LAGQVLNALEKQISSFTLVPADGGRFEVTVNGRLVYSKLAAGRHAEPGEVLALIGREVE
jgi:selenoprotein W-related protein